MICTNCGHKLKWQKKGWFCHSCNSFNVGGCLADDSDPPEDIPERRPPELAPELTADKFTFGSYTKIVDDDLAKRSRGYIYLMPCSPSLRVTHQPRMNGEEMGELDSLHDISTLSPNTKKNGAINKSGRRKTGANTKRGKYSGHHKDKKRDKHVD